MIYFLFYSNSQNKIEVKLDLSNYAAKSYLKSSKDVDISQHSKKDDIANSKLEVDKLNIDKLEGVTYS